MIALSDVGRAWMKYWRIRAELTRFPNNRNVRVAFAKANGEVWMMEALYWAGK